MRDTDAETLERLLEAVAAGAKRAFLDVRRAHPDEQFYAFILYTIPELFSVGPASNTEEGLLRSGDLETRWNPSDWAYYEEGYEYFGEANKTLSSLEPLLIEEESVREEVWKVFHDALKRLDSESLFGSGTERDAIVLNVMWGDQHLPTHFESAERLNPPAAFLAYAHENLNALRSLAARSKVAATVRLVARVEKLLAQPRSADSAFRSGNLHE